MYAPIPIPSRQRIYPRPAETKKAIGNAKKTNIIPKRKRTIAFRAPILLPPNSAVKAV